MSDIITAAIEINIGLRVIYGVALFMFMAPTKRPLMPHPSDIFEVHRAIWFKEKNCLHWKSPPEAPLSHHDISPRTEKNDDFSNFLKTVIVKKCNSMDKISKTPFALLEVILSNVIPRDLCWSVLLYRKRISIEIDLIGLLISMTSGRDFVRLYIQWKPLNVAKSTKNRPDNIHVHWKPFNMAAA